MNTYLNLTGSLMLCIAPALLIWGTLKPAGSPGKIDPNPATFFIRSVVSWTNLATYFSGAETTKIKASILITSCLGLTAIFLVTIFVCKVREVKTVEKWVLGLSLLVGVFWKTSSDPVVANLLMQGVIVLSFIPSFWRTHTGDERQKGFPWAMATGAYVFMTIALLTDPQGYKPFQLVNPILSGIICNGFLAILAYRQEARLKRQVVSKTS